jgi:hypothetical protein
MTSRRRLFGHRRGRFLADLQADLRPVARPNVLVLLWRWRYEIAFLVGLPAAIIVLQPEAVWGTGSHMVPDRNLC